MPRGLGFTVLMYIPGSLVITMVYFSLYLNLITEFVRDGRERGCFLKTSYQGWGAGARSRSRSQSQFLKFLEPEPGAGAEFFPTHGAGAGLTRKIWFILLYR